MAENLVRQLYMRGRPPPLPKQSLLEEKGSKLVGDDLQTFFAAYKAPIGIEIEVEGFVERDFPKCVYWRTKEDGSLRDQGCELVSVPIAGKNIDYALWELEQAMRTQVPRWSHRCSVHVHINVRNWTADMFRNLIGTYIVFENLFFSLAPKERKGGGYAYPMRDILPTSVEFGHDDGKYCALNVGSSTGQFGTVEFRHREGTSDARQLRRWIQLIVKLHRYVRSTPIQELRDTISRLNTSSEYIQFMNAVFGKTAQIFPPTVLQYAMEHGVLWSKIFFWSQTENVRNLRNP